MRRGTKATSLLALLALGCSRLTTAGTPRPTTLDGWGACWLEGHRLEQDKGGGWLPRPSPGGQAVLFLHTRWAESWIRTEYVFLNVEVEIPAGSGARVALDGATTALLTEGSQGGVERRKITGEVAVLERGASRAEVRLDLQAEAGKKRGAERWGGQVSARVVQALGDCF